MTYDAFTGHHLTYDAEGNILQMDAGQSTSWSFVFDALNHRVRAQYSGGISEAVFDIAGRITSGWSAPTTPSESHVFADGQQLALRSGDGNTYFVHQNWMNTDRVHTDLNGATGATYTSLPFGDGGSANVTENYAGWDFQQFGTLDADYWDSTYHAQYRNYSETEGRWTSPDPYDGSYDASNPQSFNRYAYVLNNPLSFIDPSGLDENSQPCGYDAEEYPIYCTSGGDDGPTPWYVSEYGSSDCGSAANWSLQCSGSSNTASGSATPTKQPAPNSVAARLACAAKYGQAHSLGAAFGGGTVANFLGGNSVSSVLNLGLALTGNQPLSSPPNLTGLGIGLPVNDVLRLTGGQTNPLYGSAAGTIRAAGIKGAVNSLLGTGEGIVSLSGETSLASFAGVATTATAAATVGSYVALAKLALDFSTVAYGAIVACHP